MADPTVLEQRVTSSIDDVEERLAGSIDLTSSDLELVDDNPTKLNQTIGLRFNGLDIPQGAIITNAYIQFQVDEADAGAATLQIHGEDSDDAAAFSNSSFDVSSRSLTSATVTWTPPDWTTVGAAGVDQQTADISAIVQEIVNRSGWSPTNSVAVIITGNGERTAESFDGNASAAPLLHIEYQTGGPVNDLVVFDVPADTNIAPNQISELAAAGTPVGITASATDPDAGDTVTYSVDDARFAIDANGAITRSGTGTLDYGTEPAITVTVTATSSDLSTATQAFTITVANNSTPPMVVEASISSGNDDVEENLAGSIDLTSSDLELVDDNPTKLNQTIGLRFNGLDIPQGAIITNAYIQFQVDEADAGAATLQIHGEDSDDAAAFSNSSFDVSSRSLTSATVTWTPPDWTTVGAAGVDQQTADISAIVQEIINRSGWSPTNSVAVIITGNGERTAESFDGNASAAPLLHIEYQTGGPVNDPVVFDVPADTNTAPNQILELAAAGTPVGITASATDPDAGDTVTYSVDDARFAIDANGAITRSGTGTLDYGTEPAITVTVTATSSDLSTATQAFTITVANNSTPPMVVEASISSGSDDVEERLAGSIDLTSSDLELVDDNPTKLNQTIGLRFNGLDIPQGAIITNAYIQFQVDEADAGAATLQIHGEDSDDAAAFSNSSFDVSSRSLTSATVTWTPPDWTTVGAAGVDQQTADISAIVQEIINRSGWSPTNSVAVIITGNGERTAESFDGNASAAPLLHIEYQTGGPVNDPVVFDVPADTNTAPNQILELAAAGTPVGITASATDPDAGDTVTYSVDDARFAIDANGAITRSGTGTLDYGTEPAITVTVTATSSDLSTATQAFTITVANNSTPPMVVEASISSGNDDVEENLAGSIDLTSSDLELVDDNPTKLNQTIGLRFNGLDIPQGAIITNAYIQFQVDEADAGAATLQIHGEDSDDAAAFSNSSFDVSSRSLTNATVTWTPPDWTTVGAAGVDQQTADISAIVQEIVNRSGWSPTNSVAVIITGNGERTAESFDGNASAAPLLHIEYQTGGPVNDPVVFDVPADTNTAPNQILELAAAGTPVGITASATDPDAGDTVTYSVDDARFAIDANGVITRSGTGTLDYGTEPAITVTVTATSSDLSTATQAFTITVANNSTPPMVVEASISSGSDDVEERLAGSIDLTSSDLELVDDNPTKLNQTIGLRFNGLDIPQGAIITNAYIQFQVDEADAGAATLQIHGEDSDDAAAFSNSSFDVSSRSLTNATVTWTPPDWTTVGAAGVDQQTADISAIVQEIVNRSGWSPTNSVAVIITGNGERTAESFDGNASAAPLLHIEYQTGGPVNDPVVFDVPADTNTAPNQILELAAAGTPVGITASATDPDAGDTVTYSVDDARFAIDANGAITRSGTGTLDYGTEPAITVTVTATSSDLSTATQAFTITVANNSTPPMVVEASISSGSDDVEERLAGSIDLTSSDLELVDDNPTKLNQTIGLRFNGLDIPQGAIITNAYIQFQVDEADAGAATLQIHGEDSDDAAAFSNSSFDVSSRSLTNATVTWTPPDWTTVGAAGVDQQTADISAIVQEIVNRSGWSPTNSVAVIITGNGERTAESFDGNASAAPLLHIEYQTGGPVNDPVVFDVPADTNTAPNQILELAAAGTPVGITASATDPDAGDTVTYSVDDARFAIDANGAITRSGTGTLDYGTEPAITVTVTATSSDLSTATQAFNLDVLEELPAIQFAVFGDYGEAGPAELAVANLVNGFNPDLILTTGDNSYTGGVRPGPIDDNVGQYYSSYIGNYTGAYGTGSPVNRFFPTVGNHDDNAGDLSVYLDYFTLPGVGNNTSGNERYYDFVQGPVHFFAINSEGEAEPDGRSGTSIQAQWLQTQLASSEAPWKIVYLHHSPFSSSSNHGSSATLQWDFEDWGADAVFSGHDHIYERILRNDNGDNFELPYFVTGLGGNPSIYGFSSTLVDGSSAQYNSAHGAVIVDATSTTLDVAFHSVENGGTLIDSYTIEHGTNGNDVLTGSAADEQIDGKGGDDQIIASGGMDRLIGGIGDDLFIFTQGSGNDTIADFTPGANSDDQVDLSDFANVTTFTDVLARASQVVTDTVIDLDNGDSLTLLKVDLQALHDNDFLL